jgi:hypothetical protein
MSARDPSGRARGEEEEIRPAARTRTRVVMVTQAPQSRRRPRGEEEEKEIRTRLVVVTQEEAMIPIASATNKMEQIHREIIVRSHIRSGRAFCLVCSSMKTIVGMQTTISDLLGGMLLIQVLLLLLLRTKSKSR